MMNRRMKKDEAQKDAWIAFVDVVRNFLGCRKADSYKELVRWLLRSYQELGCNKSIKIHFQFSHFEQCSDNLGDYSDEQGESFYQNIKVMEERRKGRCDMKMMADFCWSIKRDKPLKKDKRFSKKRRFKNSTLIYIN